MGFGKACRMMVAGALAGGALALCGAAQESETSPHAAEQAALPAASPSWRPIPAENLLLIDTEHGLITIELNPAFAPKHVERIRTLASSGVLNGERFYRVIEGFVAQAGLNENINPVDWPNLENENDRPYGGEGFVPLGNRDLFAPEVGHIDGFPVGRDQLIGEEWLLHCPGAVAMARDVGPDTGSTEFYIVLGAQRYLDRNLTIFGRVIDGMDHVQALKRGKREIENGVIQPPDQGDEILEFFMASDLPAESRPKWEAMVPASEAFEAFKRSRRVRDDEFFYRKPPELLDICSLDAPVRLAGE